MKREKEKRAKRRMKTKKQQRFLLFGALLLFALDRLIFDAVHEFINFRFSLNGFCQRARTEQKNCNFIVAIHSLCVAVAATAAAARVVRTNVVQLTQ